MRRLAIGLLVALLAGTVVPSHADAPSATPRGENKTWFLDADCRYALVLWQRNANPPQHWVEVRPRRKVKLLVQLVQINRKAEVTTERCFARKEQSGRRVEAGLIEVDADADKTFELDLTPEDALPTKMYPLTVGPFPKRDRPYRVQARTVAPNGLPIVAQFLVYSDAFQGVRIAKGKKKVSKRKVRVKVFPTPGATHVVLSNDPGFKRGVKRRRVDIGPKKFAWKLGPGRRPSVHVRFTGGPHLTSFSDDVRVVKR